MDITINSAEVQAYQVTKPEIQVLTFTAPANPITTDTGGKKVTLGGVEYTIAPGADGVAIETAADVALFLQMFFRIDLMMPIFQRLLHLQVQLL